MEIRSTQVILEWAAYELLVTTIMELRAEVNQLQARVKELEGMLRKDSNNSRQPTSSDGYKKEIQNNREKSDK